MTMAGYDTNLAAEFYVLSCLHRIGLTANLTLGNKKGVDIVVARIAGDAATVEVKGTAKKYDWVVNTLNSANPDRHFIVLVTFEGRINDPTMPAPRVWVVPFAELTPFMKTRPRSDEHGLALAHPQERLQVRERLEPHLTNP